ncbi:hypothetical protein H0H93_012216 [Arthromyces matolae]|nr:hypothetical protein H0H93_012216 [Arthromyces matolae]
MHLNPFYQRPYKLSNPGLWSREDCDTVVEVDPSPHVCRRGCGLSISDHGALEQLVEFFYEDAPKTETKVRLLSAIIGGYARYISRTKGVEFVNCGGSEFEINGAVFGVPYHTSCTVSDIPIYQFTDRPLRLQYHPGLKIRDNYILDDDSTTDIDPLDIAGLISLADGQASVIHPQNDVYKTHVMYPIDDCKKLVILTGFVTSTMSTALKKGLQTLEPIIIHREVIEISIDMTSAENSELFKLIAGFVDEGIELTQHKRPRIPRPLRRHS